jgi:hypothetical protein
MASRVLIPAALVAALLLAGCMGNSVTVSGQGYRSGAETRSLECGTDGTLAMGSQGIGRLSVSVTDGDGNTIFQREYSGGGQDGQAQTLRGLPGTWTLRVSTGLGYSGQWGVTLSC